MQGQKRCRGMREQNFRCGGKVKMRGRDGRVEDRCGGGGGGKEIADVEVWKAKGVTASGVRDEALMTGDRK